MQPVPVAVAGDGFVFADLGQHLGDLRRAVLQALETLRSRVQRSGRAGEAFQGFAPAHDPLGAAATDRLQLAHFDRHRELDRTPEDRADLRRVLAPAGEQAGYLAIGGVEHAVGVDAVRAAGAAAGDLVVVGIDLVAQDGEHVVDLLAQQRFAPGLAPERRCACMLGAEGGAKGFPVAWPRCQFVGQRQGQLADGLAIAVAARLCTCRTAGRVQRLRQQVDVQRHGLVDRRRRQQLARIDARKGIERTSAQQLPHLLPTRFLVSGSRQTHTFPMSTRAKNSFMAALRRLAVLAYGLRRRVGRPHPLP